MQLEVIETLYTIWCKVKSESPRVKKKQNKPGKFYWSVYSLILLLHVTTVPRAGSLPFRFLWSVKKPQSLGFVQALFSASRAKKSFLVPEVGHTQAS